MTEWTTQGTRVKGNGHNFNCLNKITAKELANILNTYEQNKTEYTHLEQKLENINKKITRLQMTINTVKDELEILKQETTQ